MIGISTRHPAPIADGVGQGLHRVHSCAWCSLSRSGSSLAALPSAIRAATLKQTVGSTALQGPGPPPLTLLLPSMRLAWGSLSHGTKPSNKKKHHGERSLHQERPPATLLHQGRSE